MDLSVRGMRRFPSIRAVDRNDHCRALCHFTPRLHPGVLHDAGILFAAGRLKPHRRGKRLASTLEIAKQICSADLPLCAALFADASERQSCLASFEAVRRMVTEPAAPLTLERLRRAMGHAHE